jgi:hypothetical protein
MSVRDLGRFAVIWCCLQPTIASAQGQTPNNEEPFALRYSVKSSVLVSRLPDDVALFPDSDAATATGFWRARIEPTWQSSNGTTFEVAFEQRVRAFSSSSGLTGGTVLPSEADAPFRIRQLDWQFASAAHAEWRGEIDRAAVHMSFSGADVTIGRQAIGWGRGVLFGAVDLFAPFSPLEADREWRRGVDAVRGDVKLTDRMSLDAVAAFDDTVPGSAFVGRLRGYAGKADLEVLGGYRSRDLFAGVTSSAAVGDLEFHGELAVFRSDAVPGSLSFSERRMIPKVVAGSSYRFPIGNGVLMYVEYHYSGFGAPSADQILPNLRDLTFQERYLRGDMQILGRHAAAAFASYEYSPEITLTGEWLFSPVDGSGVVIPSVTWTVSDRWSVLFSGYVPHGRPPAGPTLQSEFGASPLAAFFQLRMYR